jgi:hypothetical protein
VKYFVILLLLAGYGEAGQPGISFFGFSYHPDRTDSAGNSFREFNPGIGLNYIFAREKHSIVFADAGIYSNSSRQISRYAAASIHYRIGRFSAGPAFTLLLSESHNHGGPILTILPTCSLRAAPNLSLNFLYIPRYKDLNRNSAFGMYATWHLPYGNLQ